jgi:hypothetical protein
MEILFSQENTEIRGFLLSLEKIKSIADLAMPWYMRVLAFDVYGTLVDVQGIEKTAQPFSVYRAQHS